MTTNLNGDAFSADDEGLKLNENIFCKVPIQERTGIVEAFNRQNSGPQIMLLSLAAGATVFLSTNFVRSRFATSLKP